MQIAFKFKYIHNNGLFTRLLESICNSSSVCHNHYVDKDIFILEASGNQQELEELAEKVSATIPQSLFLLSSSLEEINEFSSISKNELNSSYYEVPFCLKCQEKVLTTLNPFEECSVCGFSDTKLNYEEAIPLRFQNESKNLEESFMNMAEELLENGELELLTFNGKRHFSLLSSDEKKNSSILICDPSNISKYFSITQGELNALMLVEKPSVRLKPKVMFYHENSLQKPMYPVFFSDDKITLALSTALSKKGVFALYCDNTSSLRVSSSLEENFIISSGRDMLPWQHEITSQHKICSTLNNVTACLDKDGLILGKNKDVKNLNSVEFTLKNTPNKNSNAITFKASHGVLRSIVLENDLDEKSICNIYLSKEHDSDICSYSSKIGYISMAEFVDEHLSSPKEMIEAIRSMDEEGARLMKNFENAHPELYATLLTITPQESNANSSISKLWAMAAYFIGLTTTKETAIACEHLEAAALEFQGKSGPRIDYKIMKQNSDGYRVDPRLAIRSCISFKLAGVDEYLLSFGFIDSLADFIAEQAEFADGNIAIEGVLLSGSLFENHQLLMRTYNSITPNYKIYRNKRLSLDGDNIAAGAVTLGSE
ncbi:hypothetical protein GJV85_07525 [Sulfurimonas aquatica]|uniref:Carbamoyltransferase Kae1-like domain-containing protein n=1 Tax=Sulfurimonas aquatica TaxID=2672570 RepID=A0A975GD43_9BACT|nr:hypothetical protein [Sulfurimonas aquatica]QSZ41963.1 hypothetical protein GJV85_07525 [Sulfurimonas aquatica]